MSLWNDFWDFVGDTAHDVGDVLENTWDSIKHNPIGAITSAVAMAYGIPPGWAGALGGAAGAAATGGDVIKGAFTGGAMGYMGAQAGAATGSLGPIAQAAAMGATSAATGAVLTGQDVMTAVKAGLILGGVSGGVAKLMTPQEAIATVKPQQLADIYASGQDPLGTLIEQQGWTDSDSARAAASKAFSQNAATTMTQLREAIPDYVLKDAQAAIKANPATDLGKYVADKMGWQFNSVTGTAITNEYGSYVAANKAAVAPVRDAVSTPVEAPVKPVVATPADTIASTGLVDAADASVLAHNGYTATDVQNLVKAGYNAADLADMAATGVPASTLNALSNTQFSETQINDLLTTGNGANEIASASNLVNQGKLTVATADSLLKAGVNSYDLGTLAKTGHADIAAKLLDKGVSQNTLLTLADHNYDFTKIDTAFDNGRLTADSLNNGVAKGNYAGVIKDATAVLPTAPTTQPTTTVAGPVGPTSLDSYLEQQNFDLGTGDIAKTADSYGTQYEQDLAAQREANMTTQQRNNLEARLKLIGGDVTKWEQAAAGNDYNTFLKKMGWSADNDVTREAYQRGLDSYTGEQQAATSLKQQQDAYVKAQQPVAPTVPEAPPGTIDVGGGNYMDMQGNIVDSQGNITHAAVTPSAPINQTATGYTPEQEAQYNNLVRQGMSPADAVNQITNGVSSTTTDSIPVTGSAGFKGNESSVVPEYRTPNTDLATQADIDSGAATYNAGANAWEVPKAQEPVVPIAPPTPEIPEVIVTAPRPEVPTPPPAVEQPIVPIIVPPVPTPPMTGGTTVTGPAAPSTGGTGTGTGTSEEDNTPEIVITAPKPPVEPLTPPTQVVIPPTPKIPEVVVEPPKTEPPVTTPPEVVTPEEPITPIVPIVPPTTTTPTGQTLHGRASMGPIPEVKIPSGLNPGYITNVPTYYNSTSDAADKYYWGAHPYQPGPKFDPNLYNQIPNAPAQPFGATYTQSSATPAQILAAMQGRYPLLNTVNGPVAP